MARVALNLGVRDLAALADMSPNTVARFERGELLRDVTIERIRTVLEEKGVVFVAADGDAGEGVRLRHWTDRSGPVGLI